MNISITKGFMYLEAEKTIQSLFNLVELENIAIKEVMIPALEDKQAISNAIDECFHDVYSDIDINIYIKLSKFEYNGSTPIYADSMSRLGFKKNDIFGMSHHRTEDKGEFIRICKTNGMRYDLHIYATGIDGIAPLPHNDIRENLRKVDDFWFIAIQALGKLMRKDYLIATHLAHMLIQEGLVLQMVMRDKEKNIDFHRYGYAEELDYLSVFSKDDIPFAKTSDETYNYIS